MSSSTAQDTVDYANEAQIRVAADTRILIKKTTINVTAGTAEYALPSDVIVLRSLTDETGREVAFLSPLDAMSLKSGPFDPAVVGFYTIAATIGFYPTPTIAGSYTAFYEARPAPFTSSSDFELTGDAERLVDRLVAQMKLADDGQPELANLELGFYQVEMPRVRGRRRRQPPDRVITFLG
jgi:hypothetical protein